MDFQLVMGLLGKTQPVDLYQLGGRTDDAWNLLLAGLDSTYCSFNGSANYGKDLDCGNKPPSYVVSVSYGLYEDPAIQQQACIEFGKVRFLWSHLQRVHNDEYAHADELAGNDIRYLVWR